MNNVVEAIGPTIQLRSGEYYDFLDPWNSKISVYDIAGSLSKQCRFTGHCREFYSIAEHATNAGLYVENTYRDSKGILNPELTVDEWYDVYVAHHHDDPEAIIGDVSAPLKRLIPDYKKIEKNVEEAVFDYLQISGIDPIIKEADLTMLKTEQHQLMPDPGKFVWDIVKQYDVFPIVLQCWDPKTAERKFLERHFFLCDKLDLLIY